jgi:hypothetical protein
MHALQHITSFITLSSGSEAVASVISLDSFTTRRIILVLFPSSSSHIKITASKITKCKAEFFGDHSVLTNLIYNNHRLSAISRKMHMLSFLSHHMVVEGIKCPVHILTELTLCTFL